MIKHCDSGTAQSAEDKRITTVKTEEPETRLPNIYWNISYIQKYGLPQMVLKHAISCHSKPGQKRLENRPTTPPTQFWSFPWSQIKYYVVFQSKVLLFCIWGFGLPVFSLNVSQQISPATSKCFTSMAFQKCIEGQEGNQRTFKHLAVILQCF